MMSELILTLNDKKIPFAADADSTILDVLNTADFKVSSACVGHGYCGLCRIKILSGTVSELSCVEKNNLSAQQIQQGVRLACQVKAATDISISIENPVNVLKWKKQQPLDKSALSKEDDYAIAIDLGTTHLRLSLWNSSKQRRVLSWAAFNPQCRFGADVLTRLMQAQNNPKIALEMSVLIKQSIKNALQMINKLPITLAQIQQLLIVGNTAMLTLLSGKNYHLLFEPEYWTQAIDCEITDIAEWQTFLGLNSETTIASVPPLAGFVGSDLLAAILATGLTESSEPALLIDFGTNSEFALWDGKKLWISSVPGGPAFEGSGISSGIPAGEGAIYRMQATTEGWDYQVIGKKKPLGLCGSALVDVIAQLVESGELRRNGRFKNPSQTEYSLPLSADFSLSLKKQDVDIFQRAKAATGAAQFQLLKESGLAMADLARVCVCGAFGQFLQIKNAQLIGLLPNINAEKIQLYENTALNGCELLLLSAENKQRLEQIRAQIDIVNMAHTLNFDEAFVESLYLQPLVF